jgi:uncharacterized protein
MRLSLDRPDDVLLVTACEASRITVGDRVLASSLILAATTLHEDWGVSRAADVTLANLAPALALEPEVLLLGTGRRFMFPDYALYAALFGQGIGLEVMDTTAACRTYNILVADQRPVVAALIID